MSRGISSHVERLRIVLFLTAAIFDGAVSSPSIRSSS